MIVLKCDEIFLFCTFLFFFSEASTAAQPNKIGVLDKEAT